ncbi:MAG: 5-dehydro-4-deoxy-D-glucuronate isomerase [Cyclobacteriaceae bacterium]
MKIQFATHPDDVKGMNTVELRERFMVESLFLPGTIQGTYSMHDRMITMGIVPTRGPIDLPAFEEVTKAAFFLERRELGIINLGGKGTVTIGKEKFTLSKKECLYIGRGENNISFESFSADQPALFYVNSAPAHQNFPTQKAATEDANQVSLGSKANANERTIFQFIHENGIKSCQLVMGFTELKEGSVWNTFPPHTHLRRMEVYCYFDLPENEMVMHFMGDPEETRHIALHNLQAVISPEWSIHSGAGTSNYSFVWSMAGENQSFTDMDGVELNQVK